MSYDITIESETYLSTEVRFDGISSLFPSTLSCNMGRVTISTPYYPVHLRWLWASLGINVYSFITYKTLVSHIHCIVIIPANSGRRIGREENTSPIDTTSDISERSSQADEKQLLYASTRRVEELGKEREKCKAKRLAVGLCDRVGKSLASMGSCFSMSTHCSLA